MVALSCFARVDMGSNPEVFSFHLCVCVCVLGLQPRNPGLEPLDNPYLGGTVWIVPPSTLSPRSPPFAQAYARASACAGRLSSGPRRDHLSPNETGRVILVLPTTPRAPRHAAEARARKASCARCKSEDLPRKQPSRGPYCVRPPRAPT